MRGKLHLTSKVMSVLKNITNKHNATISNISVRYIYIIDKQTIAGTIVEGRLGRSANLDVHFKGFNLIN